MPVKECGEPGACTLGAMALTSVRCLTKRFSDRAPFKKSPSRSAAPGYLQFRLLSFDRAHRQTTDQLSLSNKSGQEHGQGGQCRRRGQLRVEETAAADEADQED